MLPCALLPAGPAAPQTAADTHYALLGVRAGASGAEIRRAYLARLVTAHPDKGGNPETFHRLKAAFEVLSDPAERLIYDERLEWELGLDGGSSGGIIGSAHPSASCRRHGGVTVVVHGQTQGERPQQPSAAQHAACKGQGPGCSSELRHATEAILALQAGGDAAGAPALAAAHVARARLHAAAGQLHHALFDAEEALRLEPGSAEALVLAEELGAAAAGAGVADGARQAAGSSSDDDDPF